MAGRTNKPETCLWCGRPLGYARGTRNQMQPRPRVGPYADGVFCTLQCAADFGRAAAWNGYRFKPPEQSDG